jgi:hypothetical protein
MEPTTIFLIVCVIVLIYMIYHSYTFNATLLMSTITPANVETKITPPVPANGTYTTPDFTFSIWVNVNDWNSMDGFYKNIISYGKTVNVVFGKRTNEVIVTLKTGKAASVNSYTSMQTLTNVPFQRWVHMAFSVSGQTLDSYMNGKLVNTQMIPGSMQRPSATDVITLGGNNITPSPCATNTQYSSGTTYSNDDSNGCSPYGHIATKTNTGFSGWVKQFQYWPSSTDPQTIFNIYQQSVGSDMFGNFFGNYGLSVSLTNNGVAQNTISI